MILIPKKFIALDFETFYDPADKYSLRSKGMSITQYIRDPRFKAQCVGVRTNRMKKARVMPVGKLEKYLKTLDWENSLLLAHHCHFDAMILLEHFGIKPQFYACTMSMARLLHDHDIGAGLDEVAKYYGLGGKVKADALKATAGIRDLPKELMEPLMLYCGDDVDDMVAIFNKMREKMSDDEMVLIHHTIRAYADPVLEADRPRITKVWEYEKKKRRALVGNIMPYMVEIIDQLKLEEALDELPIARNKPSAKHPLGSPKKVKDQPFNELEQWLMLPKLRGEERFSTLCTLLNSDAKASWILAQLGGVVPTKWSEKQEKDVPALALGDLEFQELALSPSEAVRAFHEARVNVKSDTEENKAWRMLEHSKDGKALPIYLNYAKAHTNRWTGGDLMNPQNFGRGSELRRSILAPRGHKVIVVDSGQIEPRTNGLISGQDDLLEAFKLYDRYVQLADKTRNPAKKAKYELLARQHDPYRLLAADVYGIAPEDTTKDQRFVGKVGVLGLGYQMGFAKYQYTLEAGMMGPPVIIDQAEAKRVVDVYRKKNWAIRAFWDWLQRVGLDAIYTGREECWEFGPQDNRQQIWFDKGQVHKPNGTILHYKEMERSKGEYGMGYRYKKNAREWGHIYGGLLCENLTQSLARDIVADQLLLIGDRYRIATMTHDEAVYLAKSREASKAFKFGMECFSTTQTWYAGLPLIGDGGYDDCYSK